MGFQPGHQHGNAKKPKLFERALKMQIAAAGDDFKALREIAAALIDKARSGDLPAIKEFADRIDGKVAQAIHHGQDEDADATRIAYDDRDIVRRLAFMMLAPPEKVSDIE